MKTTIILLFSIFMFSGTPEPTFCDCWPEGYKEGWCYHQGNWCAQATWTPHCPYPEYGKDKCKDGYNRGFKKGEADYKERNW